MHPCPSLVVRLDWIFQSLEDCVFWTITMPWKEQSSTLTVNNLMLDNQRSRQKTVYFTYQLLKPKKQTQKQTTKTKWY